MKNLTLTSVFVFCFALYGFGQWERVDIPRSDYQLEPIISFQDKLLMKSGSEYFISAQDSIHWEYFDLKYPLEAIVGDTAYAIKFDDGLTFGSIVSTTDLINWKEYDPNLWQLTDVLNVFDEVIYVSHKWFYRYHDGLVWPPDTTVNYFSSSAGSVRYSYSPGINESYILSIFTVGKLDSLSTESEVTRYTLNGEKFEWVNQKTDRTLTKTKDGKKFIIEYSGRFKEKIRYDNYRYLFDNSITAQQFIRKGIESVLIGVDSSSNEHFVAQYFPSNNWQITFRHPEKIPFKRLEGDFLFGTDSSRFYFLDLKTNEFFDLPWDESLGKGDDIRRAGDHFFITGKKGIFKLGQDLIWKPANKGLNSSSSFIHFFKDGNVIFALNFLTDTIFVSDDQTDSWQEISSPDTLIKGIWRTIFKKDDKMLFISSKTIAECNFSTGDCAIKFDIENDDYFSTPYRKDDEIVVVNPTLNNCLISKDFGATWDTTIITTDSFPDQMYGRSYLRKKDTLSFRSPAIGLFYSFDFGQNWSLIPETNSNEPEFFGFDGLNKLMAFEKKIYPQAEPPSKAFYSFTTKKLGAKIWEEHSIFPFGNRYFNQLEYFGETLYFSYFPNGIYKKTPFGFEPAIDLNESSPFSRNSNFKLLGFSDGYAFLAANSYGLFRKKE